MSSESGGWGGVESERAGLWGLVLMFGFVTQQPKAQSGSLD